MCRRTLLYGYCLIAFGLGLLIGQWLKSWFWCGVGGIALCCLGVSILRGRQRW